MVEVCPAGLEEKLVPQRSPEDFSSLTLGCSRVGRGPRGQTLSLIGDHGERGERASCDGDN